MSEEKSENAEAFYALEWNDATKSVPQKESERAAYLVVVPHGRDRKLCVAYYFRGFTSAGGESLWWVWDLGYGEGFVALDEDPLYWAELPSRPRLRRIARESKRSERN